MIYLKIELFFSQPNSFKVLSIEQIFDDIDRATSLIFVKENKEKDCYEVEGKINGETFTSIAPKQNLIAAIKNEIAQKTTRDYQKWDVIFLNNFSLSLQPDIEKLFELFKQVS